MNIRHPISGCMILPENGLRTQRDGAVGKKARVLYKQITSEVPDGKKTSSLADAVHCTYVVMVPPDENFVLDMVAGGYQVLDTVSPYYIFSCDKYK